MFKNQVNYQTYLPMRRKVYFIVFSLLLQSILSLSIAQSISKKDELENHTYHGIKTGLNYSWFKNNMGKHGLINYEFTFGYSANHLFFKKFNVQIQALAGIKTGKGNTDPPNGHNDIERVLSTHHYYFELPITLGFMIVPKLEFRAGYSYRYYYGLSIWGKSDFLNNHHEGGIITGLNFRMSDKVSIGSSLFLSTDAIYKYFGTYNGTQNLYTLKTRYFQIAFKYCFN